MGDLSKGTQSIFENVRKSFTSAAVAFQANRQSEGLKILAEDLEQYVVGMVSALRTIMGKLNELERKLDIQEAKLDKLESKLDRTAKIEAKLDKLGTVTLRVPGTPETVVPGVRLPGDSVVRDDET